MAKSNISKLEYLKKYMDGDNKTHKVKKKKKMKKQSNIKIIDNSIPLGRINTNMNSEDEAEYDLQEEKPLMYAEDGSTVITHENMKDEDSRWKPLNKTHLNDIHKSKVTLQKNSLTNRVSQRHDSSDNDLSPIRQNKTQPRVSQRHDSSDGDLSPLRQNKKQSRVPQSHDSNDSDPSPVRQPRGRQDTRGRHDTSDSDISPVRQNRCASDEDLSPVRKKQNNKDASPLRTTISSIQGKAVHTTLKRKEMQPEVLSTGKAGLRTGDELRKENELKRKHEIEVMKNLEADVSGKGAETVRRDRKTGKKIDSKLEAIEKRKHEEKQLEHDEKYAKWGRGVTQDEGYQKQLHDDIHEMEKPLARYKDDKDLDVLLRERDREGDPMLAFLSKTKNKQDEPSKPRYSGPAPSSNRFNIWPGYRYDGVDRSNGFEQCRILEINKRKTVKDAAYKWSVEEM